MKVGSFYHFRRVNFEFSEDGMIMVETNSLNTSAVSEKLSYNFFNLKGHSVRSLTQGDGR